MTQMKPTNKQLIDLDSIKAKQGFLWEDLVTSSLNGAFKTKKVPFKAYTLRHLHEVHPVIKLVRSKRNIPYFTAVDTFLGDVFIFDESIEQFGRIAASIGCKSVNGDSAEREVESFLLCEHHFSAIAVAEHLYDQMGQIQIKFPVTFVVPGSSALEAYRVTDSTLGRSKEKLSYVPIQNVAFTHGTMMLQTFCDWLATTLKQIG